MQHATDGVTLPRFMQAGVGVVSLTIGGDKTFGTAPALSNIARVYEVCARNPDKYRWFAASRTWMPRGARASSRSR
jgi:hypothetical protein